MQIIKTLTPNIFKNSSLALGMFDGVHLGHQKVILNAVNKAKQLKIKSVVVTFGEHPQFVTAKTPTKLITSMEDRLNLFKKLGIDACMILNFDEELSNMSAEQYIERILVNSLNARFISIGYDHRFGANKKGDSLLLEKAGINYGFSTEVIPAFIIDGQIVSSSLIRKYLSNGQIEIASKLLGRTFTIKGEVVKGAQRGRLLGFPTANLNISNKLINPKCGVYSGIINLDGKDYKTVVNIGLRPTYEDIKEAVLEAHILDFDGDLYGKEIEIHFVKRLPDEVKFQSEEQLKKQIKEDCEKVIIKNS